MRPSSSRIHGTGCMRWRRCFVLFQRPMCYWLLRHLPVSRVDVQPRRHLQDFRPNAPVVRCAPMTVLAKRSVNRAMVSKRSCARVTIPAKLTCCTPPVVLLAQAAPRTGYVAEPRRPVTPAACAPLGFAMRARSSVSASSHASWRRMRNVPTRSNALETWYASTMGPLRRHAGQNRVSELEFASKGSPIVVTRTQNTALTD